MGCVMAQHQVMAYLYLGKMRYDVMQEVIYRSTSLRASEGLSGRTLRKLPFLAHALLVPKVINMYCRSPW